MLPVSRLIASMRYALRDMQGSEVSDYELIEALNQAVSLLYSRLSEKFIYKAVKKTAITVDNTLQASLPSDFISVHRVGLGQEGYLSPESYRADYEGAYRITGNIFYAPEGVYGLEYYYLPARVHNLTDMLDVSPSVSPYLEQMANAVLAKDFASAEQLAQVCCHALGGGEVSHFKNTGPVEILGGKI